MCVMRRLVVSGVTATVVGCGGAAPDPRDCYHELELYRQLLALQDDADETDGGREANTDETEESRCVSVVAVGLVGSVGSSPGPVEPVGPVGSVRPVGPLGASAVVATGPAAQVRRAKYLGSFKTRRADCPESISRRLRHLQERGHSEPVLVVVSLHGLKVVRPEDQSVRVSHALRRISYATCEGARALFAFVARHPRLPPPPPPPRDPGADTADTRNTPSDTTDTDDDQFCHAFSTETPRQAEELNALVGDAFRMAFASQMRPTAPLWAGEVSGAPDSPPGIACTPSTDSSRATSRCSESRESSSSSSAGSGADGYRRLRARPLMRRLARGLTLALDDDDAAPLVADTPTTPTNPLCVNGGYMHESPPSTASARTLDNRPLPAGSPANNNVWWEPALAHAPWFQAGIPREIALEVLLAAREGSFLVRGSRSAPGCLALSLRAPAGVSHYLIVRSPRGVRIKGFSKEFASLSALVTHHSVMPELLPCPLRLARDSVRGRANDDHQEIAAIRHRLHV